MKRQRRGRSNPRQRQGVVEQSLARDANSCPSNPCSEQDFELLLATRFAESELRRHQQLQQAHLDALRRVVDAQEAERRRFARELHDQLGQELTALKLGLKLLREDPQSLDQALLRLDAVTDKLMQEVHRLAWELRPTLLDDFGLEVALRRHLQEWSEQSGVPVDFHSRGGDKARLPTDLEITLYRVTQEALTNIARHSQATHVGILFERRNDVVSLIIEDNGRGFEVQSVTTGAAAAGRMGLASMRERVHVVGGAIDFESSAGAGTSVFVRVPLKAGQNSADP